MKKTLPRLLSMVAAVLAVTACSDPLDPEEHEEAYGMEIVSGSGTVLASVNASRQVTGSLTVAEGSTLDVDIYFLDSGGSRFQVDDADEDAELTWQIVNASIAELGVAGAGHQLQGKAPGNTSVRFIILHGGHSDYESPLIPIVVSGVE